MIRGLHFHHLTGFFFFSKTIIGWKLIKHVSANSYRIFSSVNIFASKTMKLRYQKIRLNLVRRFKDLEGVPYFIPGISMPCWYAAKQLLRSHFYYSLCYSFYFSIISTTYLVPSVVGDGNFKSLRIKRVEDNVSIGWFVRPES